MGDIGQVSELIELLNRLREEVSTSDKATEELLAGWYAKRHFFLFTKNQRVTNLQLAELRSLVRNFCHSAAVVDRLEPIYFSTSQRGREYLRPAIDQLYRRRISVDDCATMLFPVLQRLVLADPLMTSLLLRPPLNLDIDLRSICAYSGYVHSCGDVVYLDHLEAADAEELKRAILDHVRSLGGDRRVFLSAFSHEDHTTYDRVQEEALRDGLDGVKVYLEKLRVGSRQLVELLRDLDEEHSDVLAIPPAGDWSKTHAQTRSPDTVDKSRSLWLISDDEVAPTADSYTHRYLICYDQTYRNGNCLHLMDESKPAFTAPTTIPHTPLGAMINLTLPWTRRSIAIVDPFCGAGTTSLELLKWPNVHVDASDIDKFTILAARDNATFFALSREELMDLDEIFKSLTEDDGSFSLAPKWFGAHRGGRDRVGLAYAKAIATRDRISEVGIRDFTLPAELLQEIEDLTFVERMVFYLVQRTLMRHQVGLERGFEGGSAWIATLRTEAQLLRSQIRYLVRLRTLSEESLPSTLECERSDKLIDYIDRYSAATTQPRQRFSEVLRPIVRDVRELPQDTYDIVVADPPYGLNVEASFADLGKLYGDAITSMVTSLRSEGGHLVFCVPERSHVGAQTPFFASKDYCRERVVTEASVAGYKFVDQNAANYGEWAEVAAPYYWESTRALRRSILHFELSGH